MWPGLGSTGDYQDFIRQEAKRVQQSAPERSLLCRNYILPPYVAVKLTKEQRRQMLKANYTCELSGDLSGPLRLIYETGVEVRLAAIRKGLQIEGVYHLHPWLSGSRDSEKGLFTECVAWSELLNPEEPRHAHLAWISKLPDEVPDARPWLIVDMAGNEFLQIKNPLFRLNVTREQRRGLRVFGYQKPGALEVSTPSVMLPHQDMSGRIEREALETDQRLRGLGLPAQLCLEFATFYFGVGLLAKDHLWKLLRQTRKILLRSGKAPFQWKG